MYYNISAVSVLTSTNQQYKKNKKSTRKMVIWLKRNSPTKNIGKIFISYVITLIYITFAKSIQARYVDYQVLISVHQNI